MCPHHRFNQSYYGSSLFLKVNEEDFDKKVKNMYLEVIKEIGENIPCENSRSVGRLVGAASLPKII